MDTPMLVSDLTEEGKRIIEQLPQGGFEVTTAFWLKKADDGQWYFYVISPLAEIEHKRDAYGRLYALIRQMPEPHWIDPFGVRLIGPNNPIAKDVLAIHHNAAGPKTSPIRWGGNQLGKLSVEGAYLYPLPTMAAS